MKTNNTKLSNISDSGSLENLLFSGVIYRIISEPDGLRNSMIDLCTFLDNSDSINIGDKISKIESAFDTVNRIKDKDGAFTAFETLLQGSKYCLLIVDEGYKHVFHNDKCEAILDQLFNGDTQKNLNPDLVVKINKAKHESHGSPESLITIPNIINTHLNAYLITNKHNAKNDRDLNIILIPDHGSNQLHIQDKLVKQYELTNKEKLVLTNLISGCDLRQISDQFCISLNTVRSHLKSIFRKTNTNSQSGLIRLFLNHESQLMDSYFELNHLSKEQDSSHDLFITLKSNKKICYRDYGPKDGKPLVIFHNLYGSRFHIPHDHSEILFNTKRRIIIPERPGYGKSDPVLNYNESWNEMFNEFITKIGINKFDLLGNVSSTPLVINYASTYPEMIESIILTSPLFINTSEQKRLLGELPYTTSRLVSFSKKMANMTFRLWIKSMKYDTERYIRRMINEYAGSAERHVLDCQNYIDRIVLNFKESQQNNSSGSSQDAVFSLLPLGMDLSKITVPFNIWIGDEDSLIPVSSVRSICEPLPNKTFHVRKGYGEEIFYHLFEEIIQ